MRDQFVLPLEDMQERHPGLTEPLANSYLEAARVCLDSSNTPPPEFELNNDGESVQVSVDLGPATEPEKRAWANEIDTTEAGAYACAIAATELAKNMVAIRRADTHTGADYYIAPPGSDPDDLESATRLEVSGVRRGGRSAVIYRIREKLIQAANGKSNLPAVAAVVGFASKYIELKTLEESA